MKIGGYQQLVRGEPFRGKYRKSFEKRCRLSRAAPIALASACRMWPILSGGPPDHGADPELLVPAHGSQSTEIYGYPEGSVDGLREGYAAGLLSEARMARTFSFWLWNRLLS